MRTFTMFFGLLLGALVVTSTGCVDDGKKDAQASWETEETPAAAHEAAADTSEAESSEIQLAQLSEPKLENSEVFKAKFETTAGNFVVEVHPEWAPVGAARFKELVESKHFDGCRFFRVVPGFMVQFGITGDPKLNARMQNNSIKDDKVTQSNTRGMMTFATRGPNTRTTQLFINFGDNSFLNSQGFSPFAKVVEGMEVVDKINSQYGESPDQGRIQSEGNAYLDKSFPKLDHIKAATIVKAE